MLNICAYNTHETNESVQHTHFLGLPLGLFSPVVSAFCEHQ